MARDFCRELERLSDCAESNSVNEVKGKECIEAILKSIEGLPVRKMRIVEVQARKCVDIILKSAGEGPLKNMKTRAFFTEWMSNQKQTTTPSTYLRYKVILDAFIEHLGSTADMPLSAITPRHIESFKALQTKEGKSAGTTNLTVKILRIPLNQARKQAYITSNPAEAVSLLKKAPNTRDVFSLEELEKLLSKAAELKDFKDWRGMIFLGFYAGLRISDAAHLKWENLDLEKGLLIYTPQKTASHTNKPLIVPLPETLVEFFNSLPVRGIGAAPLFPSLYGKTTVGSGGLSLTFEELMRKAGVKRREQTKDVKGKGRKFYALGFHSLRHTCVSQMANNGVDRELRMQTVGHTSDVHDQYTHPAIERQREALNKLPKLKVQ